MRSKTLERWLRFIVLIANALNRATHPAIRTLAQFIITAISSWVSHSLKSGDGEVGRWGDGEMGR
jgi:hypothetical protein